MGMLGPKYVWFLPATASGAWIFSPNTYSRYYKAIDCNISDVIKAADGFILSDKIPIRQDDNKTLSGLVSLFKFPIV